MEKVASTKLEILLENFINKLRSEGVFDKSKFEDLLIKAMLSDDRELRRVSCKIVRRLKLKNLQNFVRLLLLDNDTVIRSLALLTVAQFRDEQSFRKVIESFHSGNKIVKASAVLALGSLDNKEAYPLILDSLNDVSEEVRENAIIAWSWINDIKNIDKIIELYDREKNKNVKNRIIKSFAFVPSHLVVEKLQNIIFTENDDILVLSAVNSFYKRGINKYTILADTILLKNINYNHTEFSEKSRINLYNVVSHNIWEVKNIHFEEQNKIYKLINEDLFIFMGFDELKKASISALKNLDNRYHKIIFRLFEENLSSSLKMEIINFLSSSRVDRNLKFLLLDFIRDSDRFIKEQALFSIMDNIPFSKLRDYLMENLLKSGKIWVNENYLKLVFLAMFYNGFENQKMFV